MNHSKNTVIVGGGFAGTTLARTLERRLPSGHRVVLVSKESYTTFTPMLAEVVGASVFPEHVVAPIRQMLRRSRFVMARITDVDFERRTITANTLTGAQDLLADVQFACKVAGTGDRKPRVEPVDYGNEPMA
jgi:NADH:ubiquinone reductase (H+-translocating)